MNREIANELHRQAIKHFERRKVIVYHVNDIWALDLVQLTGISKQNDGYAYILTAIDCFSRYAWAVPIKTKNKKDVLEAFTKIIEESKSKPKFIWTGAGH